MVSPSYRVPDKLHVPLWDGSKLQGDQEVIQTAVGYKVQEKAGRAPLCGQSQEGNDARMRSHLEEGVDLVIPLLNFIVSPFLGTISEIQLHSSILHTPVQIFHLKQIII